MKTLFAFAIALFAMQPALFAASGDKIKESLKSSLPHPHKAAFGEEHPSIGIHYGTANVGGDRGTGTDYGIEYGLQTYVPVSPAIELSGSVVPSKGTFPSLTRTKLLAKANYNFGGDIPVIRYSYVGVAAGPIWDNAGGDTDLELGWSPQLGFDIPLGGNVGEKYSLGLNANYLMMGGDKPSVFALNGVAKYWF